MNNVYGAHGHGGQGGGEHHHHQGQGKGDSPFCYFHPLEPVVGVCAHCLKERLLLLASKNGADCDVADGGSYRSSRPYRAVEHLKPSGVARWRKQVAGRLLQLARWKRSGKASGAAACHVGLDSKKAAERSKGRPRRGWIRSLTRRRHGERAWS